MFWDSSALVLIPVPERRSTQMTALIAGDVCPAIWWASPVECQSAIYRRNREAPLPGPMLARALERLRLLAGEADTVPATSEVRERAGRLLAAHPSRAADALQLAAALVWCEDRTHSASFVCLYERLRDAAALQGFRVLP